MIGYFLKKRRNTAKKIIDCVVAVLVLYFLKQKRLAKKDVFHLTFEKLDSSKLLNKVVKYCEHRHQLSYREYFLLVLVKRMAKVGHPYVPEILHNYHPDLIDAIKNNATFIVVTVHNGFAFTTKFMSSHQRQVATIVADQDYVKNKVFKRTGIHAEITLIDRDQYCLLKLLKALNQNKIVCCDIDFPKNKSDKFTFISPTLFVLASQQHIPMYFARYEISELGALSVVFTGPNEICSPEKSANAFINFINENRLQRRELMLGSFPI